MADGAVEHQAWFFAVCSDYVELAYARALRPMRGCRSSVPLEGGNPACLNFLLQELCKQAWIVFGLRAIALAAQEVDAIKVLLCR